MAITRKLESKVKLAPKVEEQLPDEQTPKPSERSERSIKSKDPRTTEAEGEVKRTKRVCQFCAQKSNPAYWDAAALRRFTSDRGRIQPRARTGVCAKHQRRLSKQIKYARHLSLLPFIVRV